MVNKYVSEHNKLNIYVIDDHVSVCFKFDCRNLIA